MKIRRAEAKDADRVIELLSQVLEIHAAIRPDVFVSGTTKHSRAEVLAIFADDSSPVYVAEEDGAVIGYAFCVIKDRPKKEFFVPGRALDIDDLCVDASARGVGVGEALFRFVKEEAKRLGCESVTLNVWEGNAPARAFYEKMGMRPQRTVMEYFL